MPRALLSGEITPMVNQPFPKIPDSPDSEKFEQRKDEIEQVEAQLKVIYKNMKALTKQRRGIYI